jgi:glycosyltransferase involved in cell wall biosynthesis
MPYPIVSVIIPSFNREKLILKAIDSVLNQTYQDFEILVIDDASTDNTEQVIKGLGKENIQYFRMEKNGGQCIARNFGISKAKGKYVAFLDSDDEWLPEKLRLQVACFENGSEKLGCVYGYAYQKDVIKNETSLIEKGFFRGDIYDKFLEGFCPPTPSLFMVKKEAIQQVNGFDEKLITFVDLDIWLRLSQLFEFDYIEEPLIIKYVNNFEKRYKGFKLFMTKWENNIIKNKGSKGYKKLKKTLSYAVIVPILEHPPKNLRKNIFKLLKLLLSVKSTYLRFYAKAFLILIFGPGIIYFIRKNIK